MKIDVMKVGDLVWCQWKHCYLWYNGKAYNAKDYEFVDAGDRVVVMNAQEVEKLRYKKEMPSRWWEPGAEDAPDILPEEEWIPEDVEVPFE